MLAGCCSGQSCSAAALTSTATNTEKRTTATAIFKFGNFESRNPDREVETYNVIQQMSKEWRTATRT